MTPLAKIAEICRRLEHAPIRRKILTSEAETERLREAVMTSGALPGEVGLVLVYPSMRPELK